MSGILRDVGSGVGPAVQEVMVVLEADALKAKYICRVAKAVGELKSNAAAKLAR